MMNPIIKGHLCVPEQKSVPPMPGAIMAPQKVEFKPLIEGRLQERLEIYKAAAVRLKDDIPRNDALTVIDAYNKGMLYELEMVIADLESLLSIYTK